MMGFGEIMKSTASKSLVIKINLAFLAFFLAVYLSLLLRPPSFYGGGTATSAVRCSSRDCLIKKVELGKLAKKKTKIPATFVDRLKGGAGDDVIKIGLVNMRDGGEEGMETETVDFERVSGNLEWKDLFPEWIDEEEENEGASCPEIPMPDFSMYGEVDVVAARVPCRRPAAGWARDVFRLQVHLVAANLAVRRGRRDGRGAVRVVVESECRPMMEIFRCDDVVGREGRWWMFEVAAERLEETVALPVGSCKLALPLWQEGTNEEFDVTKLANYPTAPQPRREAYATVLHSSDAYVCGAIALAQSLLRTATTRHLLLLHDSSIPPPKLRALSAAGWLLHPITRIRNPFARTRSYNEFNYSKLRLWQLTHYSKLVFVDADIVVLRNLDLLFRFPQLSAVGNDGVIFNSGVMVVEPSHCTFNALMAARKDVVSYNGGDQGFLNEVFVWWHRLPRRVNFLKNFWSNGSAEVVMKDGLFGSDPPRLYAIHYLGLKPWLCYREYDCNWNIGDQRVYASDVAHGRWWKVFDGMGEGLKGFCGLTEERKGELERDRKEAKRLGLRHWRSRV